MIGILLGAAIGYLLGSIPFGLVLTRLAGLGDIRHIGSGNIGATNVLRTGNKALAALVAAVAAGVAAAFMFDPARAGLIASIALLIILRHHENIRRLLDGSEGRISFGKG